MDISDIISRKSKLTKRPIKEIQDEVIAIYAKKVVHFEVQFNVLYSKTELLSLDRYFFYNF